MFRQLTIEKIQRPDLGQLEQVFAGAFGDEVDAGQIRRRINRARQFYPILHPLSKLSVWVKNLFNIYVIKMAGQVVGFIQISYLNPAQIHIDYIAFSKKYRGQGLGTQVLNKLLTDLADTKDYDVVLEVGAHNPAYNFYRRLGFQRITEILHYGKTLSPGYVVSQAQTTLLTGFRKLEARDRPYLYRLYLESVPLLFRQVVKRTFSEFSPSMAVRNLEWLKNYLMRKEKTDYVVEKDEKIVALLTINSYVRVKSHVCTLILHPAWESLRQPLMNKAVSLVAANNDQGTIATTIYSDDYAKQMTLERLGFKKDMVYHLMFRPSVTKQKELDRARTLVDRTVPVDSRIF